MWPNNAAALRATMILHLVLMVSASYGSVSTYHMPRVATGSTPFGEASDFLCPRKGYFPVPGSCQDFYHCDDIPGQGLIAALFSCSPGSTFAHLFNRCLPSIQVTTRPECVPLQRRKRFFSLLSIDKISLEVNLDIDFNYIVQNKVDLTQIEHKLDGMKGKLDNLESSVIKSRIENQINAEITQSLIHKGRNENLVNFELTRDLIGRGMLENRLNAALTQGLIVEGNIANEMNFATVRGSIGDIKKLIERRTEEAKSAMEKGFQNVITAIDRVRTEQITSQILTLIQGYHKKIKELLNIKKESYQDEMTRDGGFIEYLQSNTLEVTLHTIINHINQRFSVPTNASDVSSVINILDLLVEGFRTHANMLTHEITAHIHLAGNALQNRNLDDFNTFHSRAIRAIRAMLVNLGYDDDSGLNNDVSQLLEKVRQLPNASDIQGITQFLLEKKTDLNHTEYFIKKFVTKNSFLEERRSITKTPDFTKSSIPLPIGHWKNGAKVQYAVQLISSQGLAAIGDWSTPYTVFGKAHPTVTLPFIGDERNCFVYRKFNGETPELVAIVTNKEQRSFRDIGKDLLTAASEPNEELAKVDVQRLLDGGADINIMLENGMTPLHYAAKTGNVEVMEILLRRGADLHAKANGGEQALHFAALKNQNSAIEFLISKGFFVNEPIKSLGWTPLHIAAANDHGDAIRALIRNNASKNAKDSGGLTPFHYSTLGTGVAFDILLGEPDIDVNAKANGGETPLHYAAQSSNVHLIKTLLERTEIEVNAYTDEFLSPLHYAAMTGTEDTIGSLIQHGASPFIFDKEGSSPLHHATFYGNKQAVLKLREEDQLVESAKNWAKQFSVDLAVDIKNNDMISSLRNKSELVNDEFKKEYLTDTGISIMDIDCTHGMAQEMATGSEETCIHIGHITNYIDVIMSKQILPVSDDQGEFKQIISDYNEALQKGQENTLRWKRGEDIFDGIQQAFAITKKFECAFENKYRANQKQLGMASQVTVANKLQKLIAFLEQVKTDASKIKQNATDAKQNYLDFQKVLETDIKLFKSFNQNAKQSFNNLVNQHISAYPFLKLFRSRQEETENGMITEKQRISTIYGDIYDAYKGMREIRMQVIQKIEHAPTRRFATTISSSSSHFIAQPLLTLESPSDKEQIRKLKEDIDQNKAKIQSCNLQLDGKQKLIDNFQKLINKGRGNLKVVERAYKKVDCSLKDIMEMVPFVQSSFTGTIDSLEKIETTFSRIIRGISDMILKGKTATTVEEKENTLNSIYTDLAELRCHWKDTGVTVTDLRECSNNFYFIYPKSNLVHTQC